MKKLFLFLTLASLMFMCSCENESTIGIIGGADGPTSIIVGTSNNSAYSSSDKFFIDKAIENTVTMGELAVDPDVRMIYSSSELMDNELSVMGEGDYSTPTAIYTVKISENGMINFVVGMGEVKAEAAQKLLATNRIRIASFITRYNALFGANKLAAVSVASMQEGYVMPEFEGNFGIYLEYDGAYSSFTAYEKIGEGVVEGTTNFIFNDDEKGGTEKLMEYFAEISGAENVIFEKVK